MKLRMRLFVAMFGLAALLCAASSAFAVTGACVNCHTMHNSQDGQTMTFVAGTYGDEGGGMLLRGSGCAGCHADATAAAATDADGNPLNIPQVRLATGYSAGGTFQTWVDTSVGDTKVHNVIDLSIGSDENFSLTNNLPPGFNSSTVQGRVGTNWTGKQLTCAGTYGCHGGTGDASLSAMEGAHHDNGGNDGSTALDGSTIGQSYRFLKGIKGIEMDSSAGWVEAAGNHNVYYGAAGGGSDTISGLCAQCHGDFHLRAEISDEVSASSPWTRHPTDIDMAALTGTEYDDYVYSIIAPVGATTLTGLDSTSTITLLATDYSEQIVTCVSCHRAHGSDNADLLRWDYNTEMTVGNAAKDTEGCFACHTSKDGVDDTP